LSEPFCLLVVRAVEVVCDDAYITVSDEPVVSIVRIARVVSEVAYHHIEVFTFFKNRV
jgi:hypothetical protein